MIENFHLEKFLIKNQFLYQNTIVFCVQQDVLTVGSEFLIAAWTKIDLSHD